MIKADKMKRAVNAGKSTTFLQSLPKYLTTKDVGMLFGMTDRAASKIMLRSTRRPHGTRWNTMDVIEVIGECLTSLYHAQKIIGEIPKSSADRLNEAREERTTLDTNAARKLLVSKADAQIELTTVFSVARSRIRIWTESMAAVLEPEHRERWRQASDEMLNTLVDECQQAMSVEHRHILDGVAKFVNEIDKEGLIKRIQEAGDGEDK